jgi:hypothetical protein
VRGNHSIEVHQGWRTEESFQTAKNEVGLDQYQVRRYDAWYAHVTLTMTCPNRAVLDAVIDALVAFDERLRSRPQEQMLWDWDNTWLELTDEADSDAGGTIILGVAWYDRAFFEDRKVAWFGAMHQRIYQQIGVPLEQVEVSHYLAAEFATWTPEPTPAPQTTDVLTGATA